MVARSAIPRRRPRTASAVRIQETFDYNKTEWDEIQALVITTRKTKLSAAERASLLKAALSYKRGVAERKSGEYLAPQARAKSWAKVVRLCDQLLEALETAGRNRSGEYWRTLPISIIPKELSLALVRNLLSRGFDPPDYLYDGTLTIGDLFELVAKLRSGAEEMANPFLWNISRLESWSGRLDPQLAFFQHILWLWTDIFRWET
jgi:hypothetical protein